VIEPTRGRVVLFTPAKTDNIAHDGKPLAAIIVHVHSNSTINLTVFDAFGRVHPRTSVQLLDEQEQGAEGAAFAEWMPYQKGQAAKTERAESDLQKALAQYTDPTPQGTTVPAEPQPVVVHACSESTAARSREFRIMALHMVVRETRGIDAALRDAKRIVRFIETGNIDEADDGKVPLSHIGVAALAAAAGVFPA
jgi:hypothetical protein